MKVLTAAQMRAVDRRTIESGIPGLILMENAGHRVVEFMERRFAPLASHRIAVLCGKGNNGGDGLAVARQLHTRIRPRALDVALFADPGSLEGDAAENLRMLRACGCEVCTELPERARQATLVVDALLGTGLRGPASGRVLDAIRAINTSFPSAEVVAIDIPSGLLSDSPAPAGEFVRADATVTFTALKIAHALPPNCDHMGEITTGAIGTPASLLAADPGYWLSLLEPSDFRHLLAPRPRDGHKGTFGHALVVGGEAGKTGAAAMAGLAALRAGAGLATVACREANFTALAPELMTEPLPGVTANKDVVALGPGLGTSDTAVSLVRRVFAELQKPLVVDADGLNALAGSDFSGGAHPRVLTPHPGEMSRLSGLTTAAILQDRVAAARDLAIARRVTLVLKGQRSLIAFADGRVAINPTGTPAMATGGSGDILTGLIAGLLAQFPAEADAAVLAAVYLHGLAGEIGAREMGEKPLIATDLLKYLPAAIHAATEISH